MPLNEVIGLHVPFPPGKKWVNTFSGGDCSLFSRATRNKVFLIHYMCCKRPMCNVWGALRKPTFAQFVYDDVAKWPNKKEDSLEKRGDSSPKSFIYCYQTAIHISISGFVLQGVQAQKIKTCKSKGLYLGNEAFLTPSW